MSFAIVFKVNVNQPHKSAAGQKSMQDSPLGTKFSVNESPVAIGLTKRWIKQL